MTENQIAAYRTTAPAPHRLAKRLFFSVMVLAVLVIGTIAAARRDRNPAPDTAVHEVPVQVDLSSALKDYGPVPPFSIDGLSNSDMKGEVKLVVLFASWCPACLQEHPVLMELSKNVPVYGIDVTDKAQNVEDWLRSDGNPYRKIGHDDDGTVGISFGADGLPTSFIVDAAGHIVYRHDGPIRADEAKNVIIPLIKKLSP